jgi:hypothetical protein
MPRSRRHIGGGELGLPSALKLPLSIIDRQVQ